MAEYIEREAAKKVACRNCKHNRICDDSSECEIVNDIEAIPAADVRPVVRCRDCVYGTADTWHGGVPCVVCENLDAFDFSKAHDANWFCADGERMDGDGV